MFVSSAYPAFPIIEFVLTFFINNLVTGTESFNRYQFIMGCVRINWYNGTCLMRHMYIPELI